MGSGWSVGCGVNLATWVLQGVARNQTAAVRTMPAARDVVGEGGDDISDPKRPVHTGSGPIALGDGGRCGGQNSSSSSMNSVGS